MMKIVILVLAFVAIAAAAGGMGQNTHVMDGLVHNEVNTLIQNDPAITIDKCTELCDAVFDLVDPDEATTDGLCKTFCTCEINNNCHP